MSKYNHYAQDLNEQFIKARDKFNALYEAYDRAKKAIKIADSIVVEKYVNEKATRRAQANNEFLIAKANLEQKNPEIWGEYLSAIDYLRSNLKQELDKAGAADSGAIDMSALELLKSGIMNASDYVAMVEKFNGNTTMKRIISKYATDASEKVSDFKERMNLYDVINMCMDEAEVVMSDFENLFFTSVTFGRIDLISKRVINWESSYNMSKDWETFDVVKAMVEQF